MRLATALALLLLIAASSAGSASPRRPAVDAAGLRGEVSTSDPAAASSTVTTPATKLRQTAPPTAPLATPLPADDGQCRLSCAHTYYRCLSGDYAERCPQDWTLCLAGCSRAGAGLR